MTQPPDPYASPYQPVDYPAAGQQPPYPVVGPQQHPVYPVPGAPRPGYPVGMRQVDQTTSGYVRPPIVLLGFVLWLLAALSWPLGTLLRELVAGSAIGGFRVVMGLFFFACVGIAGVVGAVMFLRGSYHARLALCGTSLLVEVMAVVGFVSLLREGSGMTGAAAVVAAVVAVARLVLPPAAVVVSLLPGTRQYFAANLG
ncbi:hypothetical protein [Umezawaea tangerina]|uniref:Uncharacterized protein n=1 Tax=Umezawaea tangerina TaxID=84725 RepID=A0A2T0TCN9_9PSEU|nr:hypothetical protein [Umezawaea tangerina]PRY43423.1 hypothetical protein CLV43_103166 [Umezawaea tangerina]